MVFDDDFQPFLKVDRYAEMSGQAVARSAGQYAENNPRATQSRGSFVDGSVATGGDDRVTTFFNG